MKPGSIYQLAQRVCVSYETRSPHLETITVACHPAFQDDGQVHGQLVQPCMLQALHLRCRQVPARPAQLSSGSDRLHQPTDLDHYICPSSLLEFQFIHEKDMNVGMGCPQVSRQHVHKKAGDAGVHHHMQFRVIRM